jgi:GTPase
VSLDLFASSQHQPKTVAMSMSDSSKSPAENVDDTAAALSTTPSATMTSSQPTTNEEVLNVNVGVLGHVDSGKTSLVKTLSTLLSTAALDKSKQSRQRGEW